MFKTSQFFISNANFTLLEESATHIISHLPSNCKSVFPVCLISSLSVSIYPLSFNVSSTEHGTDKSDRWHQRCTFKVIGKIYSNTRIPMQVYTHTPDSQVQTVSYLLDIQIICKYYKSLTSYTVAIKHKRHPHMDI